MKIYEQKKINIYHRLHISKCDLEDDLFNGNNDKHVHNDIKCDKINYLLHDSYGNIDTYGLMVLDEIKKFINPLSIDTLLSRKAGFDTRDKIKVEVMIDLDSLELTYVIIINDKEIEFDDLNDLGTANINDVYISDLRDDISKIMLSLCKDLECEMFYLDDDHPYIIVMD